MPRDAKSVRSDDPPKLMKGNGMPVTGKRPIFMPMFTNAWKSTIPVTPPAR
jgi:hypothetical protein